MLTFTLDTNCLIALEENRPAASAIRTLLARHDAGTAKVQIVATTAAERQLDGTYLTNFGIFQARLETAGLGHLEILKPVAVLDLVYLDWCVLADGDSEAEGRRIHEALFASPYDFEQAVPPTLHGPERDKAEHKWRNRRLDGLGLHTHIHSGAEVFVTSDTAFFKARTRPALTALGAPVILTPEDAAIYNPGQ